MKMRKLLASGVAASLAVTSLATVASAAETRTFPMGQTQGTINFALQGVEKILLGDQYALTDKEFEERTKTLGISEVGDAALVAEADDKIVLKVDKTVYDEVADIYDTSEVSLAVTGVVGTRGGATGGKETNYNFKAVKDTSKGYFIELPVYATDAPDKGFLPEQYLEITAIAVNVTDIKYSKTVKTEAEYNADWNGGLSDGVCWLSVAEDFTQDKPILNEISKLINGQYGGFGGWAKFVDKSTSVVYPFLEVTDDDGNEKLGRWEIDTLSVSGAHSSDDRDDDKDGSNQSYIDDNVYNGETKNDFAGLSSQVATFFNQKFNGDITFKFTAKAADGSDSSWVSGGVPSTQVGFKFLSDVNASPNDFALFVNYAQTGDLQAVTSLDLAAGTVTFELDGILEELGGQTNGVVDNLYYGLTKGIKYDNVGTGLYVEEITLSYEDDADVEADIEDEDDAEDDATVEEDDATIEEDDAEEDDAEEDDATEDDAEVNGDVIDTPVVEDDDANPGTGVALAVVPAMVAAAAVVLSKKRK